MNKETIGENAGIVCRVLHDNKCSYEELMKATALNPLELACAIAGWRGRIKSPSPRKTVSCILRFTVNANIKPV